MRAALALTVGALALVTHEGTAEAISCSVTTNAGIAFGTYDPLSIVPLDSAGTVKISCSNVNLGDLVTITLGSGGGMSYSPRQMSSGSYAMSYNVYLDATRLVVWGDGTGGTSTVGPAIPALVTTTNYYGRIPARQNAGVGSYADTLVVTVLY
jgi:spore coat protein U-like protein